MFAFAELLIAFAATFVVLAEGSTTTPTCNIPCETITVSECTGQSYSNTGFPNVYGNIYQAEVTELASYITIAESFSCYQFSTTFLCATILPECIVNEGLVYPSRQMCADFLVGCGTFIAAIPEAQSLQFDCNVFPETPGPVCYVQPQMITTMSATQTQVTGTTTTPTCNIPCETITVSQCTGQSYSNTGFPNVYGYISQAEVTELASYITIAESLSCYQFSTSFLCATILPECRVNEGLVYPSRQMCADFLAGCGAIIAQIPEAQSLQFDCNVFAETPGPVCYAQPQMITTMNATQPGSTAGSTDSGSDQSTRKQTECPKDMECSAISICCGPQTKMLLIIGFIMSMIYHI